MDDCGWCCGCGGLSYVVHVSDGVHGDPAGTASRAPIRKPTIRRGLLRREAVPPAAGVHGHGSRMRYESGEGSRGVPHAMVSVNEFLSIFASKNSDFRSKHEQKLDYGSGYVKLLGSDIDQNKFGGDTPYRNFYFQHHVWLDICVYDAKKVHAILTKNGKNHFIKEEVPCETDQLTHDYTLIIRPDATYNILIGNDEKQSGCIYDDWDILLPKKIKDPEDKKVVENSLESLKLPKRL